MPNSAKLNSEIEIIAAQEHDFDEIWRIFQNVVAGSDTYVNRPETTRQEAYEKWFAKNAKTFIAKKNGAVVGAYLIRPNMVDLGSHVANCSYIVDANARGLGVGKALGEHSIAMAQQMGFRAIQFNFVVSTNLPAVKLWQSLGFRIIGTIPQAFKHGRLGYVDAYIMFREL